MAEPPKQWGVTPPISTATPSDNEIKINNDLIEELKRQGSFESHDETQRRVKVLGELQKITEEFVRQVYVSKNQSDMVVKAAGGKVFTYGSYRLGVFGPGSDIDTLVVAPKLVTREDFFQFYPPLLQAVNKDTNTETIEELTPVPSAFVPIIKFKHSGISIDLIFARLTSVNSVPSDMLLNDKNLLRGVDERDLRSLNGTRVTDEILSLVPVPGVFKHALRAIKLWAQRRAIYANVFGFPGGVAWAMLVARICQLYPSAISAVIVSKFFRILGQWNWPQPVLLKPIEDGPLNVRVWNPKIYGGDRHHLMPIITPAYPSMCSTHNITTSTKTVIIKEMKKAADVVDKIMTGSAGWDQLFQKHSFFTGGYKYYLTVLATSRTLEGSLMWSGLIESKIRHLMMKLENLETIALAHPFNKGFDKIHYCKTEDEAYKIAHGEEVPTEKVEKVDLQSGETAGEVKEEEKGEIKVWGTTFYMGVELAPGSSGQIDITWALQEFYRMCQEWESYNEDIHCVKISLIRDFMLPNECFDASKGETRPVRKTVIKKKILKRKISDMESTTLSNPGSRQTSATPNLQQRKISNPNSTSSTQSAQNEANTKRKLDQLNDDVNGGEATPDRELKKQRSQTAISVPV